VKVWVFRIDLSIRLSAKFKLLPPAQTFLRAALRSVPSLLWNAHSSPFCIAALSCAGAPPTSNEPHQFTPSCGCGRLPTAARLGGAYQESALLEVAKIGIWIWLLVSERPIRQVCRIMDLRQVSNFLIAVRKRPGAKKKFSPDGSHRR